MSRTSPIFAVVNPKAQASIGNMHEIEPYFRWRDMYIASEDERSPFYGRKYSEFFFQHRLYNYYLHPQWDEFGSSTLYCKLLFADYEEGTAFIELIGEWNDALHNDIMELKRNVVDMLMNAGIRKFVFSCEYVLNFHASDDDDYYAEWAEEIREARGWVALINTRQHVIEEMKEGRLDYFLHFGEDYNDLNWRPLKPHMIFPILDGLVSGQVQRIAD